MISVFAKDGSSDDAKIFLTLFKDGSVYIEGEEEACFEGNHAFERALSFLEKRGYKKLD